MFNLCLRERPMLRYRFLALLAVAFSCASFAHAELKVGVGKSIITPDPLLDTRWAMSSWGQTLRASCVDEAAFTEFYESNAAFGPEDICGGGRVLTEDTLAPNCGE